MDIVPGRPCRPKSVSRRTFAAGLAGMASCAALGTLTGCSLFASDDEPKHRDKDSFDVDDSSSEAKGSGGEPMEKPAKTLDDEITEEIAGWNIEQKVAQLFFVRPESFTGMGQVTAAGDTSRTAYGTYPVGGICYFAENLVDPAQTTEMLTNMAQIGVDTIGHAPFLAVDEEGGTVTRIASNPAFGVTDVGDMAAIGDTGDVSQAKSAAQAIAGYLKPLGFNMDFAPCCDIANVEGGVMAQRSFGSDPELVSDMVEAQIEGFVESGMLCSAKHFPGIGAAIGDSHDGSISIGSTLEELQATELVPFQRAVQVGVPFVMVGHLSVPNVTGDDTPASISKVMVTDVLRDQLQYDGIVVTDSLEMGAVTAYGDAGAVMALQAGCDMVLMPLDFAAAYNAVLAAVSDGTLSEERIDESLTRILRVKMTME
ncbi:glycoside hydrolase family 3 protein [Slackia heliotrinireducens]|uniref:glycoside hydrolase family 3 protein n=1 Tax=Slackia heliotrinireducens TaxID=84110 RepID=UPI00145E3D87|nr:glycoside hydrolase family 3 N-terminal domain-containing protein [Slackia heliotrinireducens]